MRELELLISAEEISQRISSAAHELNAKYKDEQLILVMVMKGAICLAADLIRKLTIPCALEFVQASSYGHRGAERGELSISGLEPLDLHGKNVLVVDDIFDSGNTLCQIVEQISEKRPKKIESLVLLNKAVPKKSNYLPDYILFDIENHFVVGYGLDYKEHYRGLPGVYFQRSALL